MPQKLNLVKLNKYFHFPKDTLPCDERITIRRKSFRFKFRRSRGRLERHGFSYSKGFLTLEIHKLTAYLE